MSEYRLVINLNDSSITTKQVGDDGLFKIRKVDGFRAYPCASKSDVQEYLEKLKKDCFNVTNFTKDTFNVILLSECSNQEIVDAVKAEIQDTTFTVLDSTFSKAFNSDDNNAEDLEKLKKSIKLFQDQVSQLRSKLSFFGSIVGYYVKFGRDNYNEPLRWLVCDIEDNCLELILEKGIPCSEIISINTKNIEQKVYSYLNNNFLEKFTSDEIAIMQPCSNNSNDKVDLPSENEITKIFLPRLNESANSAQSTIISVVKDRIDFRTNLSNQILLKNNKIYQFNSKSIVDLNEFLNKKGGVYCYSLFAAILAFSQELKEKFEKISVYPVIKVQLENIE